MNNAINLLVKYVDLYASNLIYEVTWFFNYKCSIIEILRKEKFRSFSLPLS